MSEKERLKKAKKVLSDVRSDIEKGVQKRKSDKVVRASDQPFIKKVVKRITKGRKNVAEEPFSDMTNRELYNLGDKLDSAYGTTRASQRPIGVIELDRSISNELNRRRKLEKNIDYKDPIFKMGNPTQPSGSKESKRRSESVKNRMSQERMGSYFKKGGKVMKMRGGGIATQGTKFSIR